MQKYFHIQYYLRKLNGGLQENPHVHPYMTVEVQGRPHSPLTTPYLIHRMYGKMDLMFIRRM